MTPASGNDGRGREGRGGESDDGSKIERVNHGVYDDGTRMEGWCLGSSPLRCLYF